MPSICLYVQVHQPWRLRRCSFFRPASDHTCFDDELNGAIFRSVAERCYLPANRLMRRLIEEHEGAFRFACSISGTALQQMERFSPETLASFTDLVRTGGVELLGETSHHSLAALYDEREFHEEVRLHRELIRRHFGVTPQVFRNTELIYSDEIARMIAPLGYRAILAEGADDILAGRSPNRVYRVSGTEVALLTRNYPRSDDIAFRFSDPTRGHLPLTAERFARSLLEEGDADAVVNLFMDYETFGEHHRASTGIFDLLAGLPGRVLSEAGGRFLTPIEVVAEHQAVEPLPVPRVTSWADEDRGVTAWRGNRMQRSALQQIFELGASVRWRGNSEVLETWRRLLTSDHFYYMSTKSSVDGEVHAYFRPYESPYEAFINYMNVLRDFRASWLGLPAETVRERLVVGA